LPVEAAAGAGSTSGAGGAASAGIGVGSLVEEGLRVLGVGELQARTAARRSRAVSFDTRFPPTRRGRAIPRDSGFSRGGAAGGAAPSGSGFCAVAGEGAAPAGSVGFGEATPAPVLGAAAARPLPRLLAGPGLLSFLASAASSCCRRRARGTGSFCGPAACT
jgi:hypothetical protein